MQEDRSKESLPPGGTKSGSVGWVWSDEGSEVWETRESLESSVREAGFHLQGNGEPWKGSGGDNMILHFIRRSLVDGGETEGGCSGRDGSGLG